MSLEKFQNLIQKKENITGGNSLILHNDDHNTFDFVIESLISVCGHTPEQAEQCTLITHYKGKCKINEGDFEALKLQYEKLLLLGLTVTLN